jgi:two-component system, OmpR family, alkaline phosphatase synthesis response regulator PhoP
LNRWHLTRAGYRVLLAADADKALEMATLYVPDLILLDIVLPRTDGLTLLSWLKNDPATFALPVLLISLMPDEGRWRELGAEDYLIKPISSDALIKHVRRTLATKKSVPVSASDGAADTGKEVKNSASS